MTTAMADVSDKLARLYTEVKNRQPTVWALLCHGRVAIRRAEGSDGVVDIVDAYLPRTVSNFDVGRWWEANDTESTDALTAAALTVLGEPTFVYTHWIIPVPDELADFVARNTGRPLASRFLNTVVPYQERDGLVWLTPPEAVIYDRLKAAGWTFIPQPAVVLGEEAVAPFLIPDFLIYWKGRVTQAVFVEVDSDQFHSKPSRRDGDERKRRFFQSLGFQYLAFSAVSCLNEPNQVLAQIKEFCVRRFETKETR